MIAPDEFAEVIEKIDNLRGEHWKSLCQLDFM